MKRYLAALLLGAAAFYPVAAISQTDEQAQSQPEANQPNTDRPLGYATKDMYGLGGGSDEKSAPEKAETGPRIAEISAAAIQDRFAVDETGEEIGEIIGVVRDEEGTKYIVVTFGGFLGFGEKHFLRSIDRIRMRDDDVVISLTDDQLSKLPHWQDGPGYEEVPGSESLSIEQDT